MSIAVITKTARDTLLLWLTIVAAIVLFEFVLVAALREFAQDLTDVWFKRAVLRSLIKALLGADLAENVSATSLLTIGFAHPILYSFVWGFLLATCTRVISGEIDRGTADLLLTLPLSRARVYLSISTVWMLAGIPICFAPLIGVRLGSFAFPMNQPVDTSSLGIASVNLFALYLAIGCGTMLVASYASRRGPAVGIVLALLLASFLLSFLTPFWPLAERLSFLGILDYYRPLASVLSEHWPLREISVLCSAAAGTWLVGLWRFSRRDIPAA